MPAVSEYTVHKAVELDKVKSQQRTLIEGGDLLRTYYIAQAKYDGCNCVVIVPREGPVVIQSRTGEDVKSMDHVKAAYAAYPDIVPGVYLGEAWCPDATFPEISGWFRKQSTTENTARLQHAVFDYLTLEEWEAGRSELSYVERVVRMPESFGAIAQGAAPMWLAQSFGVLSCTFPGTTPQELCNKLVEAGGYDGAIFRDPDGEWVRGNGTDGNIVKVKAKYSFDLRVVGYEEGKGKHAGRIGTLVVEYNGKRQGAGTGLKDKERSIESFETEWLGQIVEVECLGVTEDGMLREPRMKGKRFDKVKADGE